MRAFYVHKITLIVFIVVESPKKSLTLKMKKIFVCSIFYLGRQGWNRLVFVHFSKMRQAKKEESFKKVIYNYTVSHNHFQLLPSSLLCEFKLDLE